MRAAAAQTTADNPILPLAPEDCWFLLNFVLSAFAERFSAGVIRYDAGQPVQALHYRLFLTCEKVGEDRIHKVRALLLREELLRDFPYLDTMPDARRPQPRRPRRHAPHGRADVRRRSRIISWRWRFTSERNGTDISRKW